MNDSQIQTSSEHHPTNGAARESEARHEPPDATRAGFLVGPWLLEIFSAADAASFDRFFSQRLSKRIEEQNALIPQGFKQFRLPGVCVVCGGPRSFTSDYMYASPDAEGRVIPAWRERQICACGFNCRQRSCFHLLTHLPGLHPGSVVYCTEQGALYQRIRSVFPHAEGSEYLGDKIPLGALNDRGIRNEDVTRLTYADASFDAIFSLDVLEHVPDYPAALTEMARCLRPSGWLLLTTPMYVHLQNSVVRASVADGGIVHHLPPVYHGDPIDPKGVLCFHDFGWDLVDTVRRAGFSDVEITAFTAPHYGYLGLQFAIVAQRSSPADAPKGAPEGREKGEPTRP
jgi:hypothetical protein